MKFNTAAVGACLQFEVVLCSYFTKPRDFLVGKRTSVDIIKSSNRVDA